MPPIFQTKFTPMPLTNSYSVTPMARFTATECMHVTNYEQDDARVITPRGRDRLQQQQSGIVLRLIAVYHIHLAHK